MSKKILIEGKLVCYSSDPDGYTVDLKVYESFVDKINEAIDDAITEGVELFGKRCHRLLLKVPFKKSLLKAKTDVAPIVFDKAMRIIDCDLNNCNVRASVRFYPCFIDDNKGIACKLYNIQVLEDDYE